MSSQENHELENVMDGLSNEEKEEWNDENTSHKVVRDEDVLGKSSNLMNGTSSKRRKSNGKGRGRNKKKKSKKGKKKSSKKKINDIVKYDVLKERDKDKTDFKLGDSNPPSGFNASYITYKGKPVKNDDTNKNWNLQFWFSRKISKRTYNNWMIKKLLRKDGIKVKGDYNAIGNQCVVDDYEKIFPLYNSSTSQSSTQPQPSNKQDILHNTFNKETTSGSRRRRRKRKNKKKKKSSRSSDSDSESSSSSEEDDKEEKDDKMEIDSDETSISSDEERKKMKKRKRRKKRERKERKRKRKKSRKRKRKEIKKKSKKKGSSSSSSGSCNSDDDNQKEEEKELENLQPARKKRKLNNKTVQDQRRKHVPAKMGMKGISPMMKKKRVTTPQKKKFKKKKKTKEDIIYNVLEDNSNLFTEITKIDTEGGGDLEKLFDRLNQDGFNPSLLDRSNELDEDVFTKVIKFDDISPLVW